MPHVTSFPSSDLAIQLPWLEFQSKSMDGHAQSVDGPVHASGNTLMGQCGGLSFMKSPWTVSSMAGAVLEFHTKVLGQSHPWC